MRSNFPSNIKFGRLNQPTDPFVTEFLDIDRCLVSKHIQLNLSRSEPCSDLKKQKAIKIKKKWHDRCTVVKFNYFLNFTVLHSRIDLDSIYTYYVAHTKSARQSTFTQVYIETNRLGVENRMNPKKRQIYQSRRSTLSGQVRLLILARYKYPICPLNHTRTPDIFLFMSFLLTSKF